MNIQVLQHVPFEGPATIGTWAQEHGHEVDITHVYRGDSLPSPNAVEFLIVMGGPMSVGDVDEFPWLELEKRFIEQCLDREIPILGVCLGAQLLADVLGAPVGKNPHREIGWFPIDLNPQLAATKLIDVFPEQLEVFHWHGDTFSIPAGAIPLASSEACQNQGFVVDDRVVGLQFHVETTPQSARLLIENCANELDNSQYVQSAKEMLADEQRFASVNQVVFRLLDRLAATE